jgi:hypothetical protein
MALERKPKQPVPEGAIPLNATAHIVKNDESFETLSQRYGVSMDDIIYFNFKTNVPEEVNWYLNHYVGCKRETRGQRRAEPGGS